jgi:hypothetical protein
VAGYGRLSRVHLQLIAAACTGFRGGCASECLAEMRHRALLACCLSACGVAGALAVLLQAFVNEQGGRHKFFNVWPYVRPLRAWIK